MSDGLFANDSAPYAPFKVVGTAYAGTVVRTSKTQQTSYVTKKQREAGKKGEPLWWEKPTATSPGRPKMVYIITINTDLRDPNEPGDNGDRSLWISGKQMEGAVKQAVREAGAAKDGIVVGGWFGMRFTHETATESDGEQEVSATKHYEATYRPPEPGATEIIAGPGTSADPWAQPQNPFPASDPWTGASQGSGAPPQQYTQGGVLPPAPQTVTSNTSGAAIPLDVSGATPEAQKLIAAMLAQQQAAQGGGS